jgi:hypothetical protein
METSSITRGPLARANVRSWACWELPRPIQMYVVAVPLVAFAVMAFAGTQTTWHVDDLLKFLLLLTCGLLSVATTPRSAYVQGGITRDFITVWVLPVAVLLPPIYAMVMPAPLYALTLFRVHRGVIHRKVFTAAAIALA